MLATVTLAASALAEDPLTKFNEYNQRACPWSYFKEEADYTFFTRDDDEPAKCAQACLDNKDCTGFEVGPHTSHKFNDKMYCALWLHSKCNDESKMLHLGGYKAKTFVLKTADVAKPTTAKPTTAEPTTAEQTAESNAQKNAEFEEDIDEAADELDDVLAKQKVAFNKAVDENPIILFAKFPQRACPWSRYTEGKDWKFASKTSDDANECAKSCVAAKGCTGFEIGPHTSEAFDSITYCALWFDRKCGDEKDMLHLGGYQAVTYVMAQQVDLEDVAEVNTPFGEVELAGEEVFVPEVSKEHYSEGEPNANSEETGSEKSAVSSFNEYPQLACVFSHYRQGKDWMYTPIIVSDEATQADSCASICLKTKDCTGFEIGTEPQTGNDYCALWLGGSCSCKESMMKIPASSQSVSTFVLAGYSGRKYNSYTIIFLCICTLAILVSVFLTTCICVKVFRRACARPAEAVTDEQTAVPGELVQATVVKGTPVGHRVDVVVLRGEPVVSSQIVEEK